MPDTIIVAFLSLIGTLVGTFGGILVSNKLINYRLQQLEKKVEEHNNLVSRMYKVEKQQAIDEEEIEHLKQFHK